MKFSQVARIAACAVAALALAAGTGAQAQTSTAASPAPVCIYKSESYSEGAFLCIRKGLMLGCTAAAGKVNWNVVADRELSNLCGGDDYRARVAPRHRYAQRRRPVEAAAIRPPGPNSAKCFVFNGKSYCE